MSRTGNWEYSFTSKGEPGPGLLFHDHILLEPCAEMKELAMGFPTGYTITIGVREPMRHKILGACMDCNIGTWIFDNFNRAYASDNRKAESTHFGFNEEYKDMWIVDGRATQHFTGHRSDFIDYHDIQPTLIHGMNMNAIGTGTIRFQVETTSGQQVMTIPNVLYVPDMIDSPTKVTRLYSHRGEHDTSYGYPTFTYTKNDAWLEFDDFRINLNLHTNRNLCTMHTSILPSNDESGLITVASRPIPRELLHRRLGHISEGGMERLMRHVSGISMKHQPLKFCETCAITKSVRLPSGNWPTSRDFAPFEKVGCDIWCSSTASVRGFNYVLGITCYKTSYTVVYLMKTKDEAPSMADKYLRWVTSNNYKVKDMRCDSDAVFRGEAFRETLEDFSVEPSYSAPYTPTQNTI
jgi:hypothetical protein